MNRFSAWIRDWQLLFLGIAITMSGYLAWGILTISHKSEIYEWLGALVSGLTILFFSAITLVCKKREKQNDTRKQWLSVCIAVAFLYILLFIRIGISLWKEGATAYFFVLLLWCIVSISSVFILFEGREYPIGKTGVFFKSHIGIILLMTTTALLCIEHGAFQYKWDGLLYYLTCQELHLDSLSSLAIYGHIAQTFGALVRVADLMIGNTALAMLAVHLVLMFIGIVYFYAIIRHCLPNRTQCEYVLMTAVFAWSPYLLGMVHYYSLDFICQCLLPPVIYYFMKRQWILFSVFSLLFCFTKEPAIVVYGILCVSVVVRDFMGDTAEGTISDRKENIEKKIATLFKRQQYYVMVIPGILWLTTYKMLGPWSAGEGGFGLDFAYIADKLKNLYILNFNWLFTIAAIVGLVGISWKKDCELTKIIFPILCMQMAFTAFSCLFKTVNHPRYNDANQVTLYLLAIIPAFTYVGRTKICRNVSAVAVSILALLMVFSSFFTIDPVSLLVYPVHSVGETSLIMTGDIPFGDGMIYNRQMLDMENALDLALADSISDNVLVCFPAVNNNPYYFDGMVEVGTLEDSRFDVEYWDIKNNKRVPEKGANTVEFTAYQMTNHTDWSALEAAAGDNSIDLIYMTNAGDEYYGEMRERYTLIQENSYTYGGWIIYKARFGFTLQ